MRFYASLAGISLSFLGGCILLYNPGDYQVADGESGGAGSGGAGSGGTGGGDMGGGGGVGGSTCMPKDKVDGSPVGQAISGQWTWVPAPNAMCLDGSSAGFGVRTKFGSTKLAIFFDGRGACFSAASCAQVKSSFTMGDLTAFGTTTGAKGIFDTSNPANPLKDWNFVYIPDCTGDFHAGTDPAGFVKDLGVRSFTGYSNVGYYMSRIVPTFSDVTEVTVIGISAGGFGALYNYERIASDFCGVPVNLINDSGVVMSDTYFPPCLQSHWRTLWGVDTGADADCPEATNTMSGGNTIALYECVAGKHPERHFGLIASTTDADNATFYGFGQDMCNNINSMVPTPLPPDTYTAGLTELRQKYLMLTPWSSYYINGSTHTFLSGDSYYSTISGNTPLSTWVGQILGKGTVPDVGP